MKHLKKFCLLLGAFVVILALTLGAIIYVLFDADRYKSAIAERLSTATGMEVTVNQLSLGILRGVAIEGRDIVFKDPVNPYPNLTIERLSLGLKTKPLLSKQVIIKRLNVMRPVLHVTTSPTEKQLEIKPLATRLLSLASQAAKSGFFLEVRSVDIQQGKVAFHEAASQDEAITEFSDLKLSVSGLKSLAPTRYAVSGKLSFNNNTMPFSFRGVTNDLPTRFDPALVAVEGNGRIQNVPGRLVKNFLMPQGPVQALEGIFDIRTHYRGNLGGTVDAEGDVKFTSLYVDYPKLFKGPLRAEEGTIKYALTFKDDNLMVRRFEIASKETAFNGSFTIENITSEHGALHGQLSTTAMAAEDVVQLLPSTSSKKIKGIVSSMKPSGEMEVKNLEASGPFQVLQSDESLGPILTASADLVLRNLGLTFDPDIPPFKNWKGEISYNGRDITFLGVGGRVGEESLIESIDGSVQRLSSENPVANLTIVTHLTASDFRKLIQKWLSRERSPFLSDKTVVEGDVQTNLTVVGPIKQASKLNIAGSISFKNLSINDPLLGLSLDNISGVIKAQGGHLEIQNLSVSARNRPIRISGIVSNYMGEVVSFKDLVIGLGDGLPQLQGINGNFDKKKYALVIETSKPIALGEGRLNTLYARMEELNKTPTLQLSLQGKPTAKQVSHLAKFAFNAPNDNSFLNLLEGASGLVDVDLNASGPLKGEQGISWATQLYLDGLSFPEGHSLESIESLSGKLNITPEQLTIPNLKASMAASEISISGAVENYLAPDPLCNLIFESEGLEVRDALRLMHHESEISKAGGVIAGRLLARGPFLTKPESSLVEGALSLDKGYLSFDSAPPVENISAELELREGEAEIKKADLLFQKSPVSVSGTIKGLAEPLISLNVHLKSLDIDQMARVQDGETSWVRLLDKTLAGIEKASEGPMLSGATLNVDFEIEEGKLKSYTFGPIKSHSVLKEGKLTLKNTEIVTVVGTIVGEEVYMDFSGMEPTIFGLKGALVDGDASRIVSSAGPDWDVVTGTLNASASLKCREEGLVRGLIGCLDGHLLVRLKEGYVRKVGVVVPLSEKLKFAKNFRFNRPDTVPTLPYHTISGDFVIHDSILTTNNFSIDGSKIKIATDGQINLFQDTMDLKVSVLTFDALNQIVHRIPLVSLLAEDDKSLVATYYEVSGVVEEPQVVSIQNRSLEMVLIRTFHKIFEVPTRIIKAPIELMNQIPPAGGHESPSPVPVISDN
jgi:hypothetical protein